MSHTIDKLSIEGYKSIRELEDFELRSLNVLIGANGAGKSNFVGFFRLLRALIDQGLQVFIQKNEGGADACLYLGPKVTERIAVKLRFGPNVYEIALAPTADNRLVFESERIYGSNQTEFPLGSGHAEALLKTQIEEDPWFPMVSYGAPNQVYEALSKCVVYHFHDTSATAGVRRQGPINDNEALRADGENLAAFLHRIRNALPKQYEKIRDVVRLAAPFFDDFKLRPVPGNEDLIQIEWLQKGSDYPFRANQLSDGTLRFMCLATALLQPSRPATVLFDEPELGLHPYALGVLGGLFRQAVAKVGPIDSKQVIISTQSAALLSEFDPEDVIVVEREHGQSTFRRLNSGDLSEWLQEYSLGELWQTNVLGGRPAREEGPDLVDAVVTSPDSGSHGGDGN
jgi:predicted ATPase